MKVVLDCNVIVSFLISPGENISKIRGSIYANLYKLLISEDILNEIKAILTELELRGYISSLDIESLIKFILSNSIFINIVTHVAICRDPKDNKYLECSKDGKANYLVSGDADLLVIKRFIYTRIVNPPDFTLILLSLPQKIN